MTWCDIPKGSLPNSRRPYQAINAAIAKPPHTWLSNSPKERSRLKAAIYEEHTSLFQVHSRGKKWRVELKPF